MKNRLYIVLCFLFLFGGPSIDAGELGGISELVIVQGKNGGYGIIVRTPSEYMDGTGNLIVPIELVIQDPQTGQTVFSVMSNTDFINLNGVKTGRYRIDVKIGNYLIHGPIQL